MGVAWTARLLPVSELDLSGQGEGVSTDVGTGSAGPCCIYTA